MYRKPLNSVALMVALASLGLSSMAAESAIPSTGQSSAQATAETGAQISVAPAEVRAYFLHIEGRALPLRQALVNGVNVLGGAVISLSLPLNISGYTKAGLNNLVIDYTSDPKSNLTVVIEKRTPGPKIEEISKIVIPEDDSKGAAKTKTISFNLPTDGGVAGVGELSDADKAAIKDLFDHYYKALASAKADQVRALYSKSLAEERKLSPENARFFDNVIAREVAVLKNKELKLNPINDDGLAFRVEGDAVKLYRQDSKPLVESNEVDANIAPLMIEVGSEKSKSGKKSQAATTAARTSTHKDIEIKSSDFKAAENKDAVKPEQVKNNDTPEVAAEIPIDDSGQVFDGSKPAKQTVSNELPVKTAVKERLVRFNLYFKPSKPDSSGKRSWTISLHV